MKNNSNSIQTPLAKAKGLGSSHHGTAHVLAHDITTLTNIPLIAWVIYSIVSLRNASYEEFTAWMTSPISIVFAILFVISMFRHFALELQVVFEDYIPCLWLRNLKVIGMKLFFFVLAMTTIISILKIAFMAGA